MAKKSSFNEGMISETGKWNASKDYSSLMIMKPLQECNEYQKICWHGSSELIDEFVLGDDDKIMARIAGLNRYITTLKMLISNTTGQVRPQNKTTLEKLKEKLSLFHNSLNSIKKEYSVQGSNGTERKIKINEQIYNYIFEGLVLINEEVSAILTDENLVYYKTEDFDADKAKEEVMKRVESEG